MTLCLSMLMLVLTREPGMTRVCLVWPTADSGEGQQVCLLVGLSRVVCALLDLELRHGCADALVRQLIIRAQGLGMGPGAGSLNLIRPVKKIICSFSRSGRLHAIRKL